MQYFLELIGIMGHGGRLLGLEFIGLGLGTEGLRPVSWACDLWTFMEAPDCIMGKLLALALAVNWGKHT